MKKKFLLVLIVFLGILVRITDLKAQGFTKADRERLIRLETTLQMFMEQTNKRFEDMNQRFADMNVRFKELREDINKRFELMDKRFEQMDKRFEQVDKRFEQVDKRFEQMMDFLWMLTGIFTTMTLGVIGFAYWDRRTTIKVAKDETVKEIESEGKLKNLIKALRELARSDQQLAHVLRSFGLL
ncbi:MAG: hypothetical protein Q9M37_00750 [Desulfonauticus sp.]|nr:hypothetical protein [Desulfonauticus sp.]